MSRRYVLHPGYVYSRNDGDRHFVGAVDLARLYGVRLSDCLVDRDGRFEHVTAVIHLRPRFDGDYRLPEASQPTKGDPK